MEFKHSSTSDLRVRGAEGDGREEKRERGKGGKGNIPMHCVAFS